MVDEIEVTVTDREKKHPGKSGYEGMYSIANVSIKMIAKS